MQEATIHETNSNTSEDTNMIIEEQNSRYNQTPKITGMMSEPHIEVNNTQIQTDLILLDQGTNTSGRSHTQIEKNRDQTRNTMGKVQAQKTIPEQEARTIEQSNIAQIDEMEIEDIQVQATIRSWNTEDSEQNTQPKSYKDKEEETLQNINKEISKTEKLSQLKIEITLIKDDTEK
ncbi:25511_t:CDS:2, partial [Gigaspora margarita]